MELKTATDELSPLAERAVDLAGDRGVRMVPVVPIARQGAYVYLEPEDMDLEDFLDLVVAAQQKLAYIEPSPFDIDDVVELAEDDALGEELDPVLRSQRAKLRQSAARFNGWPISLEVAFMYQGVVHRWVADASWYEQLRTEVAAVVPPEDEDDLEPQLSEAERVTIVERLTQELLAKAEFRGGTETGRRRVARIHLASPECDAGPFDELPNSIAYEAIRQALDQAAIAEQRHYADVEQRIPELAQQVAADPSYRAARTAAARKHRLRDHLIAHADGYPPPTRVLDLLLDALTTSRASGPVGPMLPFASD
ncbi:hypothetical protein [Streptosporangium sp. NPDC000509]|uniref:hypothetical protein n=1 Tax=Streptosporangium sp. NPDC000509 TaxID=3366186 RepID=UPI00368720BE